MRFHVNLPGPFSVSGNLGPKKSRRRSSQPDKEWDSFPTGIVVGAVLIFTLLLICVGIPSCKAKEAERHDYCQTSEAC